MSDNFTSENNFSNDNDNEHVAETNEALAVSPTSSSGAPDSSDSQCPAPEHEVFRAPDGRAFAVFKGRSILIDSREFHDAVRYSILGSGGEVPTDADVRDFVRRVKGRAFSAPVQDVAVRVANKDEALYVDLANERGEAIAITADGWNITSAPPVRFLCPTGTLPLPTPSRSGDYRQLRKFIRLEDPSFCLLIANLTYQFKPGAPQPIVVLIGEQGAAKSTVTKQIRQLVDPRTPGVRRPPSSTRDFSIAASRGWLLALDNVSELKPWLSDALCTVSTGGGFGARTNHSDSDETTFDVRRPAVVNGIDDFIERDDLRDRCVFYELAAIPATERRDEAGLWREFEEAVPQILGGLFDLCSRALKELPTTHATRLPRMADFFLWGLAVERAAGWVPGTIERAYDEQRRATDIEAMEDPFVTAVCGLTADRTTWSGTASELLRLIEDAVHRTARGRGWPEGAAGVGGRLRRVAELLRRNGTLVELRRTGLKRTIRLLRMDQESPAMPSPASHASHDLDPAIATFRDDGSDGSDGSDDRHRVNDGRVEVVAVETADGREPRIEATATEPGQRDVDTEGADEPTSVQAAAEPAIDLAANLGGGAAPPPRLRPILDVLRGQTLKAKQVVAAMRSAGTLPDWSNPEAYISQELSKGAKAGVFRRVGLGLYTA